jgi:hypothetical protein
MNRWNKMWSYMVQQDTDPEVWNWNLQCKECIEKDEGFQTDQEAMAWIYDKTVAARGSASRWRSSRRPSVMSGRHTTALGS